jgi:hypothetical protein
MGRSLLGGAGDSLTTIAPIAGGKRGKRPLVMNEQKARGLQPLVFVMIFRRAKALRSVRKATTKTFSATRESVASPREGVCLFI